MKIDAPTLSARELCSLIGELGHEMATPLASILMTSELFLENPLLDGRQVRQMKCIHQAADETQLLMRRIIKWVRLATHQTSITCAPCSFGDLLDQIHARLPDLAVSAEPGVQQLWVDRAKWVDLLELVANFLGRAKLEVALEEPWLLFRLSGPRHFRPDQNPADILSLVGDGQLKKVRRLNGGLELPIAAILAERQGGQLTLHRTGEGMEIELRARLRAHEDLTREN